MIFAREGGINYHFVSHQSISKLQEQHRDRVFKAGSYQTCTLKEKPEAVKLARGNSF